MMWLYPETGSGKPHSVANGILIGPGGPAGLQGPHFHRKPHFVNGHANGVLVGPYRYGFPGSNYCI